MNKHGSAAIIMLVLLPILLTGATLALAGALCLRYTEKTNLICRQGLIEAETHILSKMDQLIRLNPSARILRNLDQASKVTMFIPIYGAISRMGIQEARAIFHSVQLNIIKSANIEMKRELLKTKLKLNAALSINSAGLIQSDIVNSPSLAIFARPKLNLTPDYYSKTNFAELMLSQIQWHLRIQSLLPTWMIQLLSAPHFQAKNLSLTLKCASTAQRKTNEILQPISKESSWQASLIEKTSVESQTIRVKQLSNLF